jgi:TRAP-type C4-dicarboxylate transport system permease small subunit
MWKTIASKFFHFLLTFVEDYASSLFLFIVFIGMFLQVVLRYLFKHPSPELFEVTQYAFPWGVLLGAAYAQRHRDHIRFNIIYEKLPRKVQLLLDLVFDLLILGLFVFALPSVLRQTFWYGMLRSEVLGIPWNYLVFCLPLFLILIIIHNAIFIYRGIREFLTGKITPPEEKPWA